MLTQLKELYSLLADEQRKKLLRLQGLVVLMAFAELGSVLSIGPFMALVGDMSQLQGDTVVAEVYRLSGLQDPRTFLFWIGVGVLVALALAATISMCAIHGETRWGGIEQSAL